MDGAVEVLRKEFGGLRTGRASASLLEPITVAAYGGTVPLNQLANVSVPEPRMITVQVWDRAMVKAVEGDPGIGSGAKPANRRASHPGSNPGFERRAAARVDASDGEIR